MEKLNGGHALYTAGNQGHIFVCVHGAGHSAMSFAAVAAHLKKTDMVVAFDHRGHGQSTCENETDWSAETLINDTLQVL